MNRDEGSYQLSHTYDRLLDATADRHIKTQKNWVPASFDEYLVMRSKRQNNVLKFWLWYMNFLLRVIVTCLIQVVRRFLTWSKVCLSLRFINRCLSLSSSSCIASASLAPSGSATDAETAESIVQRSQSIDVTGWWVTLQENIDLKWLITNDFYHLYSKSRSVKLTSAERCVSSEVTDDWIFVLCRPRSFKVINCCTHWHILKLQDVKICQTLLMHCTDNKNQWGSGKFMFGERLSFHPSLPFLHYPFLPLYLILPIPFPFYVLPDTIPLHFPSRPLPSPE